MKPSKTLPKRVAAPSISLKGKKVLYIDSYHPEYNPGIRMRKTAKDILKKRGVKLRFVFMDAKQKKSPDEQKKVAKQIKQEIENWKPDLILAADDSASKYVIAPFYRNHEIPVVFFGVNWDASSYGFPCKNVTGQVEVELVKELIKELYKFARGKKVGILTGDTLTDRKAIEYYQTTLGLRFDVSILVDSFEEWKQHYKKLQQDVDVLIIRNTAGIKGWNESAAGRWVLKHTKIPTGTVSSHLGKLALISFAKVNEEFAEFGAQTAIAILSGEAPGNLPLTQNSQAAMIINMGLAKELGISFPVNLLDSAQLVTAKPNKILYIDSYHSGYLWSDEITRGLKKALQVTPDLLLDDIDHNCKLNLVLKTIRLDTKRNKSEEFKQQAALKAKKVIDSWQPDIVIASDDNAAKYVIVPYLKDTSVPVLFCGINWDASSYGFPCSNVTGMIEVDSINELIPILTSISKGKRMAFLGADVFTVRKIASHFQDKLNLSFVEGIFVEDFDTWKHEFRRLQKVADSILLLSPVGIKDWGYKNAKEFIYENSLIPVGSIHLHVVDLALVNCVKVGEEQGWWVGKMALEVLNGRNISEINVTTNKQFQLILNMQLAKKMGIKFPPKLLEKAIFVNELGKNKVIKP